jgi:hypothetical protein
LGRLGIGALFIEPGSPWEKEGQATMRVGRLFDAMLGNASAVDTATLEKEIGLTPENGPRS